MLADSPSRPCPAAIESPALKYISCQMSVARSTALSAELGSVVDPPIRTAFTSGPVAVASTFAVTVQIIALTPAGSVPSAIDHCRSLPEPPHVSVT
jgi:hypothetical protein